MKQEILNIAIDQMKSGGYEALSFRKIAEGLDISKANIHHHFKNKESLALEGLKTYMQVTFDNFQKLERQYSGDLLGFINATESFFWQLSHELGHCGICVCDQILIDANSPEPLRKMAEHHSEEFLQMVRRMVLSAYKSGQLRSELDPENLALQANMMMNGMASMAQGMPSVDKAQEKLSGVLASWVKTLMQA